MRTITAEEIEFDARRRYPMLNDREINLICLGYVDGYKEAIEFAQKQTEEIMILASNLEDVAREIVKEKQ